MKNNSRMKSSKGGAAYRTPSGFRASVRLKKGLLSKKTSVKNIKQLTNIPTVFLKKNQTKIKKTNIQYIGAHVGVSGGYHTAVLSAESIGANCMQIFGSSPRQWTTVFPSQEEIQKYKKVLETSSVIGPVFLHASYLVNLASPDEVIYAKSIKNLTDHLRITEMIGAKGLVFHLGSGKGSDRTDSINRLVFGMNEVINNVPGSSYLIMENSAGGGDKLGSSFEELGKIFRTIKSPRIKICIDTAHAFESGILTDFSGQGVKKAFDILEKEIGMENIVLIHTNDSMTEASSNHDKHENIGEGFIGMSGFVALANDPRARAIPWILEVPGFDGGGPDKKNIDRLKKFFI